jgi:uncharacterized membrane protein
MDHDDKTRLSDSSRTALLAVIGAAVVGASVAGLAAAPLHPAAHPAAHPDDNAPGRTARHHRFGDYAVTGRTVTIHRPRYEVYEFCRDFSNLPRFMEHVEKVNQDGDIIHCTIRAPAGMTVTLDTRITEDRPGELIAWRSVEGSDIRTEGKLILRDAPAGRGTIVTAIVAWVPPAGELGRQLAKLLGGKPEVQPRNEFKRLKTLMETGGIATARRRPAA